MSKYLAVLLAAGLSACGMKGSVERPPAPAPEPLLGHLKPKAQTPAPKPQQPPQQPAEDVSTPPEKNAR